MALDLSPIFGGYTRTWKLVSQQAQAKKDGNRGHLREFRIYEHHPLGVGSIFWSKRDLVLPGLSDVLEEPYLKFAGQIRNFKDANWNEIIKDRITENLNETGDNEEPFRKIVRVFLHDTLKKFELDFLKETGFLPSELPPYLLNPHTRNARKIVFSERQEIPTAACRYFVNQFVSTIRAPLCRSIENHVEHLAKSRNPVDLFNAELLCRHHYVSLRYPDTLRQKINQQCPIVETEKDKPTLVNNLARIDDNIWIVDINDIDPLYRQRIKDSDPTNQCKYAAVCTMTLNDPEDGFPGFLLIPSSVTTHLSPHDCQSKSTFSSSFSRSKSYGKSLIETDGRVLYFDISNERRLNHKLESALNACDTKLTSDAYNAQLDFYRAKRTLNEMKKENVTVYDTDLETRISRLESLVADTAEAAIETTFNRTSQDPLILDPGSTTQIAPCLWLEIKLAGTKKDLHLKLINTKDGKEYAGINYMFIHDGKIYSHNYTHQYKEGLDIDCSNPVVSNNIAMLQQNNSLHVFKANPNQERTIMADVKGSTGQDGKLLAQTIMVKLNGDTL